MFTFGKVLVETGRQAFKMSASCARPSVTTRSRDGDVAIFTVLRQAWREEVRGEVVPMGWLRGGAKNSFVSHAPGFRTSRVVVRDVVLLNNLRTHGTESKTSRCNSGSGPCRPGALQQRRKRRNPFRAQLAC